MNLLEVKNISKTYGTGEATVHALKNAHSLFLKVNLLQSLESPDLGKRPY